MTADPGVVLDASALVAYAQNDLRALPVEELLRELREDTGAAVHIPCCACGDAVEIVRDDKAATSRLASFAASYGVVTASRTEHQVIASIVAEASVSHGLAHAMLVAAGQGSSLATYAAATVLRAGLDERLILDLDEFFRPE